MQKNKHNKNNELKNKVKICASVAAITISYRVIFASKFFSKIIIVGGKPKQV